MMGLINAALTSGTHFRLRPSLIQELNRISIQRIEEDAGRWRDVEMAIGNSKHRPPTPTEVPRYVDELCDYVNDQWGKQSALHLAAYVMWRLNWIHPFVDGNGRTTRAVSYCVLCSKLGFHVPGVTTIPELIAENKSPYYKALESADNADDEGRIDVSEMEDLLMVLLARQVIKRAESVKPIVDGSGQDSRSDSSIRTEGRGQKADSFSMKVGVTFGAGAALFLMLLVLLSVKGHPVPRESKYLVVFLFAFCGALSTGFLRGKASARGSIPIPVGGTKEYPVQFQVTEGIAVLIILLILGAVLSR